MLCQYYETVYVPNKDVLATANIDIFLRAFSARHISKLSRSTAADAVVGWDRGPKTARLQNWASRRNLPYVSLKEGFYAPHGWHLADASPISLIADDRGDFSAPEQPGYLAAALDRAVISEKSEARAEQVLAFLRRNRLSQSRQREAELPDWLRKGDKDYVLISDCPGSTTLPAGQQAQQSRFSEMLQIALASHTADRVIVKTVPERLNATRALTTATKGIRFITDSVNSWDLFEQVGSVHCLYGNLGFEALLAGREVHCHAPSFFSGRGLTRDHYHLAHAQKSCPLTQLIETAILEYPIYIDPFEGKCCTPEKSLEILADLRNRSSRLFEPKVMLGISTWKTQTIRAFTGPAPKQDFTHNRDQAIQRCQSENLPLYGWASGIDDEFTQATKKSGVRLVRIEDGFIRSAGLGVNLVPACSLVFDAIGIHYDSRTPSGLEKLLNDRSFTDAELSRAQALRKEVISRHLTKYNLASTGEVAALDLPQNRQILLVAGQVETDASIRYGTRKIKTNLALLQAVREDRPDAYIIYKPHPDVITGLRKGGFSSHLAKGLADRIETGLSADQLLELVDEVHTLTSLLGFEALMREIKVFTYGLPFYAGWGLTTDLYQIDRRRKGLCLDALVAGTLISYPAYVDPVSGLLCEPELIVQRLAANINIKGSSGLKERLWRTCIRIFYGKIVRQTLWRLGLIKG